jgi:non-homologous end joining protein Ku
MQFLPLSVVHPIYFDKTYYLGAGKGGDKPYQLPRPAMGKRHQVALAKMVMPGEQIPSWFAQELLLLHFKYYADEARDTGWSASSSATANATTTVQIASSSTEGPGQSGSSQNCSCGSAVGPGTSAMPS